MPTLEIYFALTSCLGTLDCNDVNSSMFTLTYDYKQYAPKLLIFRHEVDVKGVSLLVTYSELVKKRHMRQVSPSCHRAVIRNKDKTVMEC